MRDRVLVVGGGGFLGRHVVAALLEAGHQVASLDLFRPERPSEAVDWIVGSALDEALLASATSDCETVIFLAASSLPASANADMAAEITSHVRMVVKAAEIACSQNVAQFLFASSGGTVYGPSASPLIDERSATRPINAYGASKAAIEMYLSVLRRNRTMRTTSLRIANPYGVGQRAHRNQGFVAAAMAAAMGGHDLPCWGDGSVVRDFIYVEDVANAFADACGSDELPQEINIGSGEGRSLRDVIAVVQEVTGRRITVDYQSDRAVDVKSNVLDIGLAGKVLDWRPKVAFREGIARTAEWWLTENAQMS